MTWAGLDDRPWTHSEMGQQEVVVALASDRLGAKNKSGGHDVASKTGQSKSCFLSFQATSQRGRHLRFALKLSALHKCFSLPRLNFTTLPPLLLQLLTTTSSSTPYSITTVLLLTSSTLSQDGQHGAARPAYRRGKHPRALVKYGRPILTSV